MSNIEDLIEQLEYDDWEVASSGPGRATLTVTTDDGECLVRISDDRGDVRLDMIRATPQGVGVGTAGLQSLVAAGREAGVRLVLDVRPQAGCLMDEEDLALWYERNGAGEAPEAGHVGMAFGGREMELSW